MTVLVTVDILLVEDNPADVRLVREALREAGIVCRLHAAADGEEALAFLRRQGACRDAPHPQLVLLDLNLPRKSGHEVLAELKDDPDLRHIPVIVLTSSRADEDVLRSYDLHANAYISKPAEFEGFIRAVRSIESFWLITARLPR